MSSFAHIIFELIRLSVFGLLYAMEGLKEAASHLDQLETLFRNKGD